MNQLRNIVAASKPDSRLDVELYRNAHKLNVSVKVGEMKAQAGNERARVEQPTSDLGIAVENLNERLAREIGTRRTDGVVVTGVRPGSIGEEAGLTVRDIIISVNGKRVRTIAEFNEALAHVDLKKGARFVVENDGNQRFVFPQAAE